jgi:carbon-monoxide dehydrogenase medium subunit
VEEAVAILKREPKRAVPVAGATDLLVEMSFKGLAPQYLLDIGRLPLRYIREENGNLVLGALTTIGEMERSTLLRNGYVALVEAAQSFGSPQIRNLATVGGNIAHATPSAEMAPPLLALDGSVRLASARGERNVPLDGFFTGPGRTVREPGELITEIRLPSCQGAAGTAYLRHCIRESLDIAIIGVACRLRFDDGERIREARIALGAVAPTPIRASEAEEALRGEVAGEAVFARAAELAALASHPISDVRASASYRREMVRVYTRRALTLAARRARTGGRA